MTSASSPSEPLHDLPGSSSDAGTGPVVAELVEQLFDDAGPLPAHRDHRAAWYGELVGCLLVEAAQAESTAAELISRDHALPILLAGRDRQQVRAARDLLAEDDRVELVGVRLPLPEVGALAAAHLLAALDFTAPAWIELTPAPGWAEVMTVLAGDGAESLTLLLDGAAPIEAARLLRAVIDQDLAFRLGGVDLPVITPDAATAPGGRARYGVLNVLCAVRAALNGAEPPALAAILAEPDAAPLTSALRRMSEADAAVARGFCVAVQVDDVAAMVAQWVQRGLLTPEA
ncbi:MAG: hypothetical protein U0Q19_05420 [Kineosporiaceae bacterium]